MVLAMLIAVTSPAGAEENGAAAVSRGAVIERQTVDGQVLAGGGDGLIAGVDGRRELSLSVYNNGRALVRESRELPLLAGLNRLKFTGVAAALVPGSIRLDVPEGVAVRSQGFDGGAPGYEALLKRHVGRTVTLVRENPATGEQITARAKLLGLSNGQPMVSMGGRIEVAGPAFPWRITFDGPRESGYWRPGVRALVSAEESRAVDVVISYLTDGLGWEADYDLVLAEGTGPAALSGWARVHNTSGVDFDNTRLSLIAGEVAREVDRGMDMAPAAALERAGADVQRTAIGGAYHRYELPGRVSLADGVSRQLPLVVLDGLDAERTYRVSHQARAHTRSEPQPQAVTMLVSVNRAGRDEPLPGGIVRVYEQAGDGELRWLGEDRIAHTPVDAPLRLEVGRAFDVQAQRRQTAYQRLSDRSFESGWSIELSNATDDAVTVNVVEQLDGDWTLQEAEPSPAGQDAQQLTWQVQVPAGGTTVVSYRVRVKY